MATDAESLPRRSLPALVPGVAMLVLGFIGATRPVLSWDEIATADAARRSLPQLGDLARHLDGVFGPYYLFMHGWTAMAGDSVLELRSPSIVAMAGAVAATGELARRLFDRPVGMVAGLLLCLVPTVSRYAAEARPYAPACLFTVLALLTLHNAVHRPGWARWTAYGSTVLAVGLTHVVALSALAAHAIIVATRARLLRRPGTAVAWTGTVAAALVLLIPILWWGVQERGAQLHWVPPLTGRQVYALPAALAGAPATAWLLIGLILAASSDRRRAVLEMLLATVVPLLVILAVSAAGPSFLVPRYLLFVLMPAAIAAAAGLVNTGGGLRRPLVTRLVAILMVVAATAFPAQRTVRGPTAKTGSDYRGVAYVVRSRQRPGDVIVYQAGRTLRTGVTYYLRDDRDRPQDVLMSRTAAQVGTFTAREFPDPADRLAGAPRVWLVVFGRRADPSAGRRDLSTLLRTRYQRVGEWWVKQATVVLYARRAPGASQEEVRKVARG